MIVEEHNTNTDNDVRNKFTAYVMTALERKRMDILQKQKNINKHELLIEMESLSTLFDHYEEDCADRHIIAFMLEAALLALKDLERYIVIQHSLYGRKYDEIGPALGMSYKAVADAYRRAKRKIEWLLEV